MDYFSDWWEVINPGEDINTIFQQKPKEGESMNIKDVFVNQARKYNNYQECDRTEGRRCNTCTRWRLSYPYACNDYGMGSDKAETCLNYTNKKSPRVD